MAGAIWWVRRDLRLEDSPALAEALRAGNVTPCFVIDPAAMGSRFHRGAARRRAFLLQGLRSLDADLRARGSRLVVREGTPAEVLPVLMQETAAERIVAAADYSPFARRRDAGVAALAPLLLTGGIAIRRPEETLRPDGSPYRVFTAFRRAWQVATPLTRGDLLPAPSKLPPVPDTVSSLPLPEQPPDSLWPAGEAEALARLAAFVEGPRAPIERYGEGRNLLAGEGTSMLSPYLRFGMLSPRRAVIEAAERAAAPDGAGAAAWLSELAWRDFYLGVLRYFPESITLEMNAQLRGIDWRNDAGDIEAWKAGRTGFPVIDAAMRQLTETGWMHNRARMITASFLVKTLLCDWRIGEQWFMDQLVDGDAASNNGGWQWVAGTGTDAQPYFRVFNPVLQGRKFDPDGAYVRRWLPELASLPLRIAHEPWRLPAAERARIDYPAPIVDLGMARQRALAAYRQARDRNL